MELASRINEEISKPFFKQSKSLLFDLYQEAFGSLNGLSIGCSSCKHDAYVMLKSWAKNNNGELLKTKLNLYTSYYKGNSSERQKELDFCLAYNKASGFFDNIILIEDKRPTFKELFALTKQYPDHVNIVTNSDIFFPESILQVKTIQYRECYALSRWDYVTGGKIKLLENKDSQDTWIFRGGSMCEMGDFKFGLPGCDNRIAYELKESGYKVTNPSKRIKTVHLHLSEVKSYNKKTTPIPKPYLMIPVCY